MAIYGLISLALTIASNVGVYGTGVLNRIHLAEGESPYDYPNGPGGSDPNHMW